MTQTDPRLQESDGLRQAVQLACDTLADIVTGHADWTTSQLVVDAELRQMLGDLREALKDSDAA